MKRPIGRWCRIGVLVSVLGCGGASTKPELGAQGMASERKAEKDKDIECPAQAERGRPLLCFSKSTARAYVMDVPAGHGWRPKDRVMLRKPYPGMPEGRPIAMARVWHDFGDAVEVRILYQIPGENNVLDGAMAQAVPAGERVRLAQYVGRVLEQDKAGRVKLDVGKNDGAQVGDMYSILEEGAGDAIARVKLTEVRDLEAWGKVMDWHEPVRVGMDAQCEGPDDGKIATPISVVVVDFMAKSMGDAGEAKAGKEFARDLVKALERAAAGMPYLKVKYAPEEKVKGLSGEAEGHREAQALGKKMGADVVVWGVMQCDIRGCALPRFTVVEGSRLAQGRFRGEEIWVEKKGNGFKFEGKAPEDPLALGAALLGEVFYKAERYKDAKFYLGMALRKGVLKGRDALGGRTGMLVALKVLGQSGAAREQALQLEQEAKAAGSWEFETSAWARLAELDAMGGRVQEAKAGYAKVLEVAKRKSDVGWEGYGLHQLAIVEADQGRVEEAKKLFVRSLELARQIGDVQDEASTLHQLAILEYQNGRVDEAKKLFIHSLELKRQIGNVDGEASTLHHIAKMEADQGHVDEARKLYSLSLALWRQVGDVQGEGAALHARAMLEEQEGHVDEARVLYTHSLELKRQIGDAQGEARTLNVLALMEARQGRVDKARNLLTHSLELKRRIGDVASEGATLHALAMLEEQQGRVDEARKLYAHSLELARQIGDVKDEAATIHQLAMLEAQQGRVDEARKLYTHALEMVRRVHNIAGEIATLNSLSALDWQANQRAQARKTAMEALAKARAIRFVEAQAHILENLGQADQVEGLLASAKEHFTESLALFARLKMSNDVQHLTQQLAKIALLEQVQQSQKAYPTLLAQGAVWITKILPDGQASKTSLQPGDILLRYNTKPLPNAAALQTLAKSTPATTPVTLDILRGAKRLQIRVHGGLLGIAVNELPPTPKPTP